MIDGGVVPAIPSDEEPIIQPKQTIHGKFTGPNYKIQVGFENLETETPLYFSLSENLIEYGQLSPTDPVTRTNSITISAASSQAYTLQALENHPPRQTRVETGPLKHTTSEVIIPDTTCDNGICNETVAQPWTGTLTYGFGYRCDSLQTSEQAISNYPLRQSDSEASCLSGFYDTSSFKQFAKETPEIVIEAASDSSSTITYKINISGVQAPEFYSNQITFIAVPNF